MRRSTRALGASLALVSLPAALAAVEAAAYHRANRPDGTILVAGRVRDYVLHVPPSYDPHRPAPLVVSLHGAGLGGAAQRDVSRWNDVADAEGFIVVYPSAERGSGPSVWHVERGPGAGLARDVRFVAALIDTVSAHYRIDPARVYADGLSNGGGMAFVLSCTLSDRIAAVGLVAAAQTLPWRWCTDERPVPMIAFHGTADPQIPYRGGTSWVGRGLRFPSVEAWTEHWARRNRCAAAPSDSAVAPDVRRRAYAGCADGADVVLFTLRGGGHTWPGGARLPAWALGSTSHAIDASRAMWDFFRAHPAGRSGDGVGTESAGVSR